MIYLAIAAILVVALWLIYQNSAVGKLARIRTQITNVAMALDEIEDELPNEELESLRSGYMDTLERLLELELALVTYLDRKRA